jgi:hypothetical protein
MTIQQKLEELMSFELTGNATHQQILNEINSNKVEEQNKQIMYYNGVWYVELANFTTKIAKDNELHAAWNRSKPIKQSSELQKDTLYTWNVNQEIFNKLTQGSNRKLKADGLIGKLMQTWHNIANNNEQSYLAKDDIAKLSDAWVQQLLKDDATKSDYFKTEWSRTSKAIGVADAVWAFAGPLLSFIPKDKTFTIDEHTGLLLEWGSAEVSHQIFAVVVGSFAFPIILGLTAYYTNYYAQIEAYKEKHGGKEPTPEVLAQIKRESKQLAIKVGFAVGGWTFGYEVFVRIMMSIDVTGMSQTAFATAAVVIGLTTSAFLLCAAIGCLYSDAQKKAGGKLPTLATIYNVITDNFWDLTKLIVIAAAAASVWFVMNTLITIPMDGLDATIARVLEYAIKGTATYLAITAIFTALKPTQSKREMSTTSWWNCFSPVQSADSNQRAQKTTELINMAEEAGKTQNSRTFVRN